MINVHLAGCASDARGGARRSFFLRLATALLAALVLAGCAAAPKTVGSFIDVAKPADGQALVYIFRVKQFVGGGIWFELLVNGQPVGYLSNGSFAEIPLPPGRHTLTNKAHPGFNQPAPDLEFELAPGDVRFFQMSISGAQVGIVAAGGTAVAYSDGSGAFAWHELSQAEAVSVLFFLNKTPPPIQQ